MCYGITANFMQSYFLFLKGILIILILVSFLKGHLLEMSAARCCIALLHSNFFLKIFISDQILPDFLDVKK